MRAKIDEPRLEKAYAVGDERHRITLYGEAQLPWRLSLAPIYTFGSGVAADTFLPGTAMNRASGSRLPLLPRNALGREVKNAVLKALSTGNLKDTSISPPERYLLEFVHKVTLESHRVDERDILDLRASGWEEQQIAESVHVTAIFACFNRVANAFGLPSQDLLGLTSQSSQVREEE